MDQAFLGIRGNQRVERNIPMPWNGQCDRSERNYK